MHTASDAPQSSGTGPVYNLDRVRSPGFPLGEAAPDQADSRDSAVLVADERRARRLRWRRVAVRSFAYLAIAGMLFLFARILMDNPPIRRAVLNFVTFGHASAAHAASQWLIDHGVSIRH